MFHCNDNWGVAFCCPELLPITLYFYFPGFVAASIALSLLLTIPLMAIGIYPMFPLDRPDGFLRTLDFTPFIDRVNRRPDWDRRRRPGERRNHAGRGPVVRVLLFINDWIVMPFRWIIYLGIVCDILAWSWYAASLNGLDFYARKGNTCALKALGYTPGKYDLFALPLWW